MTSLREAAQQALEALAIGQDAAHEVAQTYHEAMAGYRPARHIAVDDDDVRKIEDAITALRAALAEPACCCGEPSAPGIVHRRDGPCYMAEPDYWQEEARRYAGNADYWRKRYETLAEPVPDSKHATIAEWWADKQCPNCASLQDQNTELDRKLAELQDAILRGNGIS